MEPYIETYSGIRFYFLDPKPAMVSIEDIAHALSNSCRYTGHCKKFYSVAEHSVAVSELLAIDAKAGLLHDASEAYLADIASPVKPYLYNYKELEDRVMRVIFERFQVPYPFYKTVHEADVIQLSAEVRKLIPSRGDSWGWESMSGGRPEHPGIAPRCLSPKRAEKLFLDKFDYLFGDKY